MPSLKPLQGNAKLCMENRSGNNVKAGLCPDPPVQVKPGACGKNAGERFCVSIGPGARMTISDVAIFLTIIRTRTISRAAEALCLSQSTISHRLKALETSLGIILLERSRGRKDIKLTPEGEVFVGLARKWVSLHEETQKLREGSPRLRLTIGGVDSVNYYIFPPLFRSLVHNDPPLELNVRTNHSMEIYALLQAGELDIGFVNHETQSSSFEAVPVLEERFLVIRPKTGGGSPEPVRPQDLDPAKEILHAWFPEYQAWHDSWWDPDKRAVARVNVPSLLEPFFDDNAVWTIVPESVAKVLTETNRLQAHEILSPPPNRMVYCVTNKYARARNSVAMRIFRRHLDAFLLDLRKKR